MRQPQVRRPALVLEPPPLLQPLPPTWVERLMEASHLLDLAGVRMKSDDTLSLLSVSIERAVDMNASELREAVTTAYADLGRALQALDRAAIRLWNYMPDPGQVLADDLDRYMVFNEGRSNGYRNWKMRNGAPAYLPTASGVGIASGDLIVHCLASTIEGRPVENPRQIPAWRYSKRYGPTPPSFSRATLASIGGCPLLLIGGTASVVGEETAHAGDVAAQVSETLENLATLIATATSSRETTRPLDRLLDIRVYLARLEDAALVRDTLSATCPGTTVIEVVLAPLCRRDLLVEIEGVAEISPRA